MISDISTHPVVNDVNRFRNPLESSEWRFSLLTAITGIAAGHAACHFHLYQYLQLSAIAR
jgi:hypothetical protein